MDIWEKLGFRHSPYDVRPLKPTVEDAELLAGRDKDVLTLCNTLEGAGNGVAIISGPPGVGKTSFFNVTQYLLESEQAPCGPQLLSARSLCPIRPGDEPRDVAQRAVSHFVKSIEEYCAAHSLKVPKETAKISKWIGGRGTASFDFSINVWNFGGGFGRSVDLPGIAEVSYERLQDVIECLAAEVVNELHLQGSFIALDNVENIEIEPLLELLLAFRDTLFSAQRVWWVLIGPSGLGGVIQARQPRLFERIYGNGLELAPISKTELHEAIGLRVKRFHKTNGDHGKAPLPAPVHDHLYKACHGEIRFVFKYSAEVCTEFMKMIRERVLGSSVAKGKIPEDLLDAKLGELLIANQVPADIAELQIQKLVRKELAERNLKRKEREVLKLIGDNTTVQPKHYARYGIKTRTDFSQNYLWKLHKDHLLVRKEEGRDVTYKLSGVAYLAWEYKLLVP